MIKFIEEDSKAESPTFEDVSVDQFFVNNRGLLCQKIDEDSYNSLTGPDGTPLADTYFNVDHDVSISRILPTVVKIEY